MKDIVILSTQYLLCGVTETGTTVIGTWIESGRFSGNQFPKQFTLE